jgi:hypothetical protein
LGQRPCTAVLRPKSNKRNRSGHRDPRSRMSRPAAVLKHAFDFSDANQPVALGIFDGSLEWLLLGFSLLFWGQTAPIAEARYEEQSRTRNRCSNTESHMRRLALVVSALYLSAMPAFAGASQGGVSRLYQTKCYPGMGCWPLGYEPPVWGYGLASSGVPPRSAYGGVPHR